MSSRWFYRCVDCLRVVATEEALEWSSYPHRAPGACGVCGGEMEEMGQVFEDDRLGRVEHRCPCDSRCTLATGPKCGCRCGGANHGSKRVVAVRRDLGPAPVLAGPDDTKARARADEWRTAIAAARAAYAPLAAEKAAGWIARSRFDQYREAGQALFLATASRSHPARMRYAARVVRICGGGPTVPPTGQAATGGNVPGLAANGAGPGAGA